MTLGFVFKYVNATHGYLDIVSAIESEQIDKKLPNENTESMSH